MPLQGPTYQIKAIKVAGTARLPLHAIGDRHAYWLAMETILADVPAWVKPGSKYGERRLILVLL